MTVVFAHGSVFLGFTPAGIMFPVSASMLKHIVDFDFLSDEEVRHMERAVQGACGGDPDSRQT